VYVTDVPIRTYHVNATCVNCLTQIIVSNPATMAGHRRALLHGAGEQAQQEDAQQ